jgi:hypothetical protein
MKKLKIYILVSVLLILAGCDIKDPVDGIDVILNQKDIATTVAVSFVDAATGLQIGSASSKKISIDFSGQDKGQIISLKELPLTSASTTNGIISFAIRNTRVPSSQNPVEFTIIASADGYLPVSQGISLIKAGSNPYEIRMVSVAAPPDGAAATTNVAVPASNGTVSGDITITTGNESVTNAASTISIPSGTQVKDASGNVVTGSLSATLLYFNNKTKESLEAFPGGLIAKAVNSSGAAKRGLFSTAGFAEFSLHNQSGQKVKSFLGKAVELSIDIPAGTMNRNTGSPVKNGDMIPVWSFDESTATWKYEADAPASGPDAKGNFKVSVQSNHLSWWNLGWLGENVCSEGATINLSGNYASLRLEITDLEGNFIASKMASSTENSVTFQNVPSGVPVRITAYDNLKCENIMVGQSIISDLCGANVNLDITTAGTNVNVKVEAFCPNRDPVLRVRPSIDIYILNSCGERIIVGKMKDGFITLKSLVVGQTYTFGVYYDDDDNPATDNWHQSDPKVIDSNNYDFDYELDASICDDL